MSIWNEEPNREVALEQWHMQQGVVALWTFMVLIMPLMWGWEIGWQVYLNILVVAVLPVAILLEISRRYMNRTIGEVACKWVWQK